MIGSALGWKYDYAQGICTKDNVITKWPASLGTQPTGEELAVIVAEYEAYKDIADRIVEIDTRLNDIDSLSIRSLRAKGNSRDSQDDRDTLLALDDEAGVLRAERGQLQ